MQEVVVTIGLVALVIVVPLFIAHLFDLAEAEKERMRAEYHVVLIDIDTRVFYWRHVGLLEAEPSSLDRAVVKCRIVPFHNKDIRPLFTYFYPGVKWRRSGLDKVEFLINGQFTEVGPRDQHAKLTKNKVAWVAVSEEEANAFVEGLKETLVQVDPSITVEKVDQWGFSS